MNWDAIGAIGEVVSAVAVLATLVYLAVQVRESGKSQALNASQLNRDMRIRWFSEMRDSPYLPEILDKLEAGEELSSQDRRRLNNHMASHWGLIYSDWVQRRLGIGEEFLIREDSIVFLLSEASIDYWQTVASKVYTRSFVEHVDSLIKKWESGT